ncbi:HBR222Wp [Eremothecium sinecaudum]|uniref:Potassium transport protein n=1 Tax=Eremothecium sinecaudum TaxID=45286 RepID=A0A109UX23_9SACH|nr:HBR222Wp [Eremothecium sinecaudum]AMD19123.1 HBR222Wp [Eremothecium sinecaudum]
MGLLRTLKRHPTLQYFHHTYKKTIGHEARDVISRLYRFLHPVLKRIFPSFIVAHYYYIIGVSLLCSIILYPARNLDYVDILFFATGAATQGGLNTVDMNKLNLYQQVVLYITCIITAPIWIHGSLVFIRLFWFERYFDGIKDWSKKYYQMRRTRTLIAREMTRTMSSSGMSARGRGNKDAGGVGARVLTKNSVGTPDFQSKLFSGKMVRRDEATSDHDDSISTASDYTEQSSAHSMLAYDGNHPQQISEVQGAVKKPNNASRIMRERFQGKRDSRDISPADMYRSILILQGHHHESDDDGQVLVIRGPHERRTDSDHEEEGISIKQEKQGPQRDVSPEKQAEKLETTSPPTGVPLDNQLKDSSALETHFEEDRDQNFNGSDKSTPHDLKLTSTPVSAGNNIGTSIQFDVNNMPRPSARRQHHSRSDSQNAQAEPTNLLRRRRSSIFGRLSSSARFRERLLHGSAVASSSDEEEGDNEESDADSLENSSSLDRSPKSNFGAKHTNVAEEYIHDENSPSNQEKKLKHAASMGKQSEDGKARKIFNKTKKLKRLHTSASFSKDSGDRWPQLIRKRLKKSHTVGTTFSHQNTMNSIDSLSGLYDGEDGLMDLDINLQSTNRSRSENYLSYDHNIGRNSTFIGLTDLQKTELGGVEYRATKLLCKLLVVYYIGFHLITIIFLLPWIHSNKEHSDVVRSYGISPTWWSFFTAMSGMNNLGLTLTSNSMMSFNKASYPLIVLILAMIIGHTGFPIILRFVIWIMYKFSRDLSSMKENLGFLLDHPRRCFTLLFPKAATWWLLLILVIMNVFDLAIFLALDYTSQPLSEFTPGYRVLNGLFQAVSTRTTGFSVLDISLLHPAIQVSYMVMMYVSVMPVAISIRRTNVYEEQSLGIYGEMIPIIADPMPDSSGLERDTSDIQSETNMEQDTKSFISAHLRKQLSFDLWFMFLGLFIICIAEGSKIRDPTRVNFTVFQVMFEVVSAYGTVGLSFGYINTTQSFSAQFTPLSKLVIIALLIRGRHRGLPYSLDRAIMLPSDKLQRIDQIEDLKLQRTMTAGNKDPVLQYLKKRTQPVSGLANVIKRTISRAPPSAETPNESSGGKANSNVPPNPPDSVRTVNANFKLNRDKEPLQGPIADTPVAKSLRSYSEVSPHDNPPSDHLEDAPLTH